MKYSFKEKQNHFQALRAAQHAVADLALLEQKAPALPQLRKFKLLPVRYADEILYALLDVCPREQIVSHRREVAAEEEKAAEIAAKEERVKFIQELIDEAAEEEGLSPEDKEKVQSIVDEILSTSVGTADTIVGVIADAICKVTTVVPETPEATVETPEHEAEATAETIASQALAESAAEEEAAAEQATEAKQELEDLQAEHQDLQTAHEELQAEHEDLETQMQELEETNEQLQEELQEEKKKEPAKAKEAPKQKKKSTPE